MTIESMNIDLETKSGTDITKAGVYRYAEDPEFDILLFGVSINHGPVNVYDLALGDTLPEEIITALTDCKVIKHAYNASFERVCLSYWLKKHYPQHAPETYLNPYSWRCSLILAAYNGLPLGLEKVGTVLGLEQQKMKEGKELIRYFCSPCKPTKANGCRTWNLPFHAPDKWRLFRQYNARDVEVEMEIQAKLQKRPVPDFVWEQYALDQEINDRGIRIDRMLMTQALDIDARAKADLTEKLKVRTGMDNPNSVLQMKNWLKDNGLKTKSLGKKEVAQMQKSANGKISEVLSLRLQLAKSSVKKYEAMQNAVCRDDRCHGMFQFYGAVRSGRWAGRLIQLQNLPQNHMPDLDAARELTKQGDYEMLDMLYPSVPGVLSELIRTVIIPEDGKKFIVADFSAIEARVLSHLAGETWRSDVFRSGGDIYCASAEKMFKVPVEKHGRNSHLRQKGKIAELALGYGGGTGALKSMGALEMGLKEEELQPLVTAWREANPNIVQYWYTIDEAIKKAIKTHTQQEVNNIKIKATTSRLRIILPSQRSLCYIQPTVENGPYGENVTYMGTDAAKKWEKLESYGPKFTENIVQAISRDILAEAMLRLHASGYTIVGHIHDEVIIEAKKDISQETICTIMQKTPGWLPGIDLKADGYTCAYYKKE